jgi:uncharacterized protein YvpB
MKRKATFIACGAVIAFFYLFGTAVPISPHAYQGTATRTPITFVHATTVQRLSQLDCVQYASSEECMRWGPSACSATSMAEVLNAYGQDVKIADVLAVEREVKAITPALGLLDEQGITQTVERFGFVATIDHQHSLEQVLALANGGTPIIVSFPPATYPPGGHILVVTGGDATHVFLADSAPQNWIQLSHTQFLHYWGPTGLTAIVTPRTGGTPG